MKRLAPILVFAFLGACTGSQRALAPSDDGEDGDAYEPLDDLGKADGPTFAHGPVKFSRAFGTVLALVLNLIMPPTKKV